MFVANALLAQFTSLSQVSHKLGGSCDVSGIKLSHRMTLREGLWSIVNKEEVMPALEEGHIRRRESVEASRSFPGFVLLLSSYLEVRRLQNGSIILWN